MSRGHDRERDVKHLMEGDGWTCLRAAGSLGEIDVIAMRNAKVSPAFLKTYSEVRFIEVKSTAGGPYERFGPNDRRELLELAEHAGASAWLAWWPPCKPGQAKADALKWIPSSRWPE